MPCLRCRSTSCRPGAVAPAGPGQAGLCVAETRDACRPCDAERCPGTPALPSRIAPSASWRRRAMPAVSRLVFAALPHRAVSAESRLGPPSLTWACTTLRCLRGAAMGCHVLPGEASRCLRCGALCRLGWPRLVSSRHAGGPMPSEASARRGTAGVPRLRVPVMPSAASPAQSGLPTRSRAAPCRRHRAASRQSWPCDGSPATARPVSPCLADRRLARAASSRPISSYLADPVVACGVMRLPAMGNPR